MTVGNVTLEHGVRFKRVMAVVRTLVSAGTIEPPGSVAHYCAVLCSTAHYCAVLCTTVQYCPARHCVSQRIRQEAVNGHLLSAGISLYCGDNVLCTVGIMNTEQ